MFSLPPLVTFGVETLLVVLLAITLTYCIRLERKLAQMRKGQDALKGTIGDLNKAISSAGSSIGVLRAASATAASTLDERMGLARKLIDELSVITSSAERLAERFDRGFERATPGEPQSRSRVVRPAPANLPSGSIMNRLEKLRAAQ